MRKKLNLLFLTFVMLGILPIFAQEVNVDVNLNIKHSVDGVSDFGRERHMTLHSAAGEGDWKGHEDMMDYLMNDLDVYFGRDNGSAGWKNSNVKEDPEKPGWPDVDYLKSYGNDLKNWYESDDFSARRQYESKSGPMIMGMVPHPNYPTLDWNSEGPGRFRRGQDDEWQIFDVKASAFLTAHYLDNHFSKSIDEIGEPLPTYWECINEPDMEMFGWHKMFVTSPELLWEYHNETARIFKEVLGDAAPKVGGLTWGQHDLALQDLLQRQNPQFYIDNGDDIIKEACNSLTWDHRGDKWWQWDGLFQGFIDNCSDNMDFYSIHIYDWPQIDTSKNTIRAGGHTEAMLDLLEWYDMHKFGEKKEVIVSEFGAVGPGTSQLPYKKRDWWNLMPFNQMMMQFLERPSHLTLTMPFAPVKAQWGDEFDENGNLSKRYSVTMMDPVGEYKEESAGARYNHKDWEWSNIILFYELWSDVKGTRIDTKSSDRDVQVDAYVDGNHVYLILNNLEDEASTVNLNYFDDYNNNVKSVHIKDQHFDVAQDLPVNKESWLAEAPGSILLQASATIVLDYEFENAINIDQESKEVKFPGEPVTTEQTFLGSQMCHKSVSGRAKFTTNINNVVVPTIGEATLRIGLNTFSTSHIEIVVNGHMVTGENDPEDWRGRQRQRSGSGWYGVFEMDIPLEYLQENNIIEVTNHRHNSDYSTFMLQVWDFSKEPGRSSTGNGVVAVNNISLSGSNSVMQGKDLALAVDFTPVNATNKGITWTSSNPAVASVNEFGVVTGVATSGTTTITATSKANNSAIATKTISAAPYSPTAVSGITINEGTSITVEEFTNTALTTSISPVDATIQTIEWSSSNSDVVEVFPNGKVLGKQVNSSAIITAKITDTESGNTVFTDNITVNVTIIGEERVFNRRLPEEIRPYPESELIVDVRSNGARQIQLELSKNGNVIGQGSTDILFYGDTSLAVPYTLSGTPQINTDYDVTFKLVDGSTVLDSRTAQVRMIDHYRAESISIIEGIRTVQTGGTIQLEAEILPANTFNKDVSWVSSNTSVASVNSSTGVVTGIGVGNTIITATSDDGSFTDQVTVSSQSGTVHIYMDTIYVPENILIFPGQDAYMSYSFYPSWATDTLVNWTSSDAGIANIDASGHITTGTAKGIVTITATAADNSNVLATTTCSVSETIIVEAETFSNTGGPYNGFERSSVGISHNQAGDWGEYEVDFPAGGEYAVKYYIGVPDANTGVEVKIYLDGILQSTTTLSPTGGYDVYSAFDAPSKITVGAGAHTIKIESSGSSNWQWNMDKFEFSLGDSEYFPVTGISVSPTSHTLTTAGGTIDLAESVEPTNATNKAVTWSSSNANIATVNSTGLVTAVANGSATITVTSNDQATISATSAITVAISNDTIDVTGITVAPTNITLAPNTSQTITATIAPNNATNQNVSWSSNDISVATVNSSGVVTAVSVGSTTITATTEDGSHTATTQVNVVQTVTPSLVVDNSNTYLNTNYEVGGTINISANYQAGSGNTINNQGVKFWLREIKSDWSVVKDVTVVDASASGNQTGTASATISLDGLTPTADLATGNFYFLWANCTSSNGTSIMMDGLFPINIVEEIVNPIAVDSVTLNASSISFVQANATETLTATVYPTNANNQAISWSSSNTSVATVNNGIVTSVGNGNATITVTTADGAKTATCNVNVTIAVNGISVDPTTISFTTVGATQTINATVSPANAANQNVTWSSSDNNVATVNAGGLVTAVANGSATITATSVDGDFTATCSASVAIGGNNYNVPGIIEAEDYSSMSGIATQGTSDVGGGDNVGWINAGDWMDYDVNVETAGSYTVEFRIASASNNIKFDLKNGSTVLTSVDNATTGGWQTWTTVTKTVSLSAGQQMLRVDATGGGWNINWLKFSTGNINVPVTGVSISQTTLTLNEGESSDLNETVSPDNATDQSVSWTSSNNNIATVDDNGLVAAVSEGSATITVETNNGGFTASCDVTVSAIGNVELTIQAEDYTLTGGAHGGFQKYTVGGIGAINWNQTGDWADYEVAIPQDGSYSVEYFVGTTVNGAAVEFILDGTSEMTDNVVNNNSWDEFVSLKAASEVNIPAGTQTIRLQGAGTNGWEWNMDRFILTRVSDFKAAEAFTDNTLSMNVYPNPVRDVLNINFSQELHSKAILAVYNSQGKMLVNTNIVGRYYELHVNELPAGMYILQISNKGEIFNQRFIKE